jgi:hypothetical protein
MKSLLAVVIVLALSGVASAQCAGPRCQLPQTLSHRPVMHSIMVRPVARVSRCVANRPRVVRRVVRRVVHRPIIRRVFARRCR